MVVLLLVAKAPCGRLLGSLEAERQEVKIA